MINTGMEIERQRVQRFEDSLKELTEIHRKHESFIKENFKVSPIEMHIVQLLCRNGKKKMKEIGDHFQVKLSTLTSIVDKIERQKFVKRSNGKEDRRVVYLDVTPKGRKLYDEYSDHLKEFSFRVMDSMEGEEFQAMVQGLEKVAMLANT